MEDKGIKPLVQASLLAILPNLASHWFLQWYFKALPVERRAEESTKVARVFTEVIFDQLGQLGVELGTQIRDCVWANSDEFCKGINQWRIPSGESERE